MKYPEIVYGVRLGIYLDLSFINKKLFACLSYNQQRCAGKTKQTVASHGFSETTLTKIILDIRISYIIKVKCSPASTPTTTPVYVTLQVTPIVSEEKMDWRALVEDGSPEMQSF